MAAYDYDLFVIGAGSGGVRAARRAAEAGARVAIAEGDRVGGTCVIRGCVPKKLLVYASQFSEHFEDAAGYGWSVGETSFDWPTLIAAKDREIARLEAAYRGNLERSGVADLFASRASFEDPHTLRLEALGHSVTAERVLIATGGRPDRHPALLGYEHCITSDEAFDLKRLPERIVIAGGGYIAVEFAGIFHGLGVETTILYRGREILQHFDMDVRRLLHAEYVNKGIGIICQQVFSGIERRADGRLDARLSGGDVLVADEVMLAVGRLPNTQGLGLERAGVLTSPRGAVLVDGYSRTNVEHIYAIGDVTDRLALTPVAIHEAMCFVDTVFHDRPRISDHRNVPTAVFSQPEIGAAGLTEEGARRAHADLDIYKAVFKPMKNTLAGRSERMLVKLVVDAATDRVLGAHALGPGSAEMAQFLGIAVKAGLTKAQFDATIAVYPTAAEEFVTLREPAERVRGAVPQAAE